MPVAPVEKTKAYLARRWRMTRENALVSQGGQRGRHMERRRGTAEAGSVAKELGVCCQEP